MRSKSLTNQKQNIFSEELKWIKGWPVILHLLKSKETRVNALPSLNPIPSLNFTISKWDGVMAFSYPCFLAFSRGGE